MVLRVAGSRTLIKARGVSRRTLDSIDHGNDLDDVADYRPGEIDKLTIVPGEVLDAIKDVFAGTRLPEDVALVEAVLDARRAVQQAWGRAGQAMVEIGRALNSLSAKLVTKEEQKCFRVGFERLFPFSDPVASQFRRVAQAVDGGRISVGDLPGSYSAAYQLALLAVDDLNEARRRGLVGAHTTRAAILAFRKEITTKPDRGIEVKALLAERRRVREQRRQLLLQLVDLRRRDREIGTLLNGRHQA